MDNSRLDIRDPNPKASNSHTPILPYTHTSSVSQINRSTGQQINKSHKRGQAMIFMMMTMVILFFVVLWNFDLHEILRTKFVAQNAGDSAALMASRWQGVTLNVIGDLNLMQAVSLSMNDTNTAASINDVQARLCFVGPMIAFISSQQAAKQNGIYRNTAYDNFIREHADSVRNDYTYQSTPGGPMLFPEPYPDCWYDYADMLDLAADEGIAAGADNASFYSDSIGGHFLLDQGFYSAVAGQTWCWFFHNAPTLLEDYEEFFPCWWSPLPPPPHHYYMNSEIYGLGLEKYSGRLQDRLSIDQANDFLDERLFDTAMNSTGMQASATWYCYGGRWSEWTIMQTEVYDFPIVGPVKDQYNYIGADAAVRVEAVQKRFTPGQGGADIQNLITWTAAAKPFGYLNDDEPPHSYHIVLPAFRSVALIPVDASTAGSGGSFDLTWRKHIEEHLPEYMSNGPDSVSASCWYCSQLKTWEITSFRASGVDWLSKNSHLCTLPHIGGGGGGTHRPSGGTSRGH